MKINKALILMFSALLIVIPGCEDEATDPVNEFEVLVEYLEGDDGPWINDMTGWIKNAGVLDTTFDYSAYTIFDIRSEADFATMSLDGAINVTMTTMFDEAANATKPILVTCYSGQSASYAHMLLRLKGYEAYVMKFGMSGYDESLDKWTSNCSDQYADDLVTTESPALHVFEYPVLETGFETAEEILDARIDYAIEAWSSRLVTAGDVISAPSSYNIINYWSEEHYLGFGHIDGAYQMTPKTLTLDGNLSALDPKGENIFYCYTGQTAGAAIAYLAVLGYDVKSIKFGFNNMNWTALRDAGAPAWSKPFGGE